MSTLRNNVESLLAMVPKAANDDNLLLSLYWLTFDDITKVSDLPKATNAESITRAKRTIIKEADE